MYTLSQCVYAHYISSKIKITTPARQKPENTKATCCVNRDVSLMPKNSEAQNIKVNPMAKLTEFMCVSPYAYVGYGVVGVTPRSFK